MKINHKNRLYLLYFGLIISVTATVCLHKPAIENIQFAATDRSVADIEKTFRSFQKQDEFFTLTQTWDYDVQMKWLNNYYLTLPDKDTVKTKQSCSIFVAVTDSGSTYHCQNFDNPESGILIGYYAAPGRYKSIAITRMTDLSTFNGSFDHTALSDMQKTTLPFFAFYPANGVNEHGLSVSIAGCYPHQVKEKENRQGVFITYLNRLMLDNCKNVSEAIALCNKYYFFNDRRTVASNHLLISDKWGNSAVVEYNQEGKMNFLIRNKADLVITNDDVIGATAAQLEAKCKRYRKINDQLSHTNVVDYADCMNILKKVENKTLWSVVMDNKNSTGYIAVKGRFNHYYQFAVK